jgi:tRNA A58 N-methylase Trm61
VWSFYEKEGIVLIQTIGVGLLLAGGSVFAASQQESVEEWEKRTFAKQPPEQVMDGAGIEPGMVIGEVGAGRGRFTVHLARRVGPEGKILANDIDEESLDYLRERCKRAGIGNVETIVGRVEDPLFPSESLDMAFMVWTYHFLDQPVIVLKNLLPALKPGATVVLVEPDPARGPGGSDHGVSPERMRREAASAGFELVRTDDFLPEDLLFVLRVKSP